MSKFPLRTPQAPTITAGSTDAMLSEALFASATTVGETYTPEEIEAFRRLGYAAGYRAAREDAAAVTRDWSKASRMQLAAGEMSAPEIRSVKAALASAIEALPVKEW